MYKTIAISFLCLCCLCCKHENNKRIENLDASKLTHAKVKIDTTDGEQFIAILQLENSKSKITLSLSELKIIELLLRKSVKDYNGVEENHIDLRYYKRQYFPQLNEKGEKLVGIYCFCSLEENEDWKNQKLISPEDGGKCYLHAMINVTKKTVEFFQTNSSG